MRASAISTSRKPSTSVSGNRSAARMWVDCSARRRSPRRGAHPEAVDVDAGQKRGGHQHGDARGKPRDKEREQTANVDARAARPWIGRRVARGR